ncbi:MAG: DUF1573 domain-containing protein [Planctomycetaceae bacterium]|nr:DUF1573 domain-containing protein [Planctomycetaceae bacterium]
MIWRLASQQLGALVMSALMLSVATAQDQRELNWAEKMFSELSIDFGVVARGADVPHYVIIENLYKEPVTLTSVGTSCSCAQAVADKRQLATHEKARIEVKMDTRNHMNRKNSNLDVTVTFDGIHHKSVRVPITAFIRSDVVVTPENANFGTVMWGTGAERAVDILYAGRQDWKITDVRINSDYLTADLKETARANGQVQYQMVLQLSPGTPVGNVLDRVVLVTDDADNPEFPILVEAKVEPDIVATPGLVQFGDMQPGTQKTIAVILKSQRPFAIEKVECSTDRNCFKMKDSTGSKTVHVLPLTITAPEGEGDFTEVFSVTVPGRPEPYQFQAQVHLTGTASAE